MKKLLAILALLLLPVSAHAQSSKATLLTEINTNFADNATGAITAAKLRTVTTDMVNSWADWLTCTGTGGIVYWASGTPTCLTIGAAGAMLTVTAGIPAWTTSVWPATTTINQLLYSSAANTVTGLATANSGILNTNASGVPSISTDPILSLSQNGATKLTIINANAGTSALASLTLSNGTAVSFFGIGGTAYNVLPILTNRLAMDSSAASDGIALNNESADPIVFGVSSTEVARFHQSSGGLGLNTTSDPGLGGLRATGVLQTSNATDATCATCGAITATGGVAAAKAMWAGTYINVTPTVVNSLPSCTAAIEGARAYVTNNATAVSFNGAVTSGGANKTPVFCDGTNWKQG